MIHLYFNGDSFVAGTELGDDILPNYPGLYNPITDDPKPFDQWNLINHYGLKKYNNLVYKQHYYRLEYERAFPYKVASRCKLPFTNNAATAASMDRIARTTITGLIDIKKQNPNTRILAFIGTTNYNRSEVVINYEYQNLSSTLNLVGSSKNKESDMLIKLKAANESDYHHLINFYKNIILVQDFCKSNDIELFWIATVENIISGRCFLNPDDVKDKADYFSLKEYANLIYALDMSDIAEKELVGQKYVCPGRHFGQPVHDLVADKIIEIINNLSGI